MRLFVSEDIVNKSESIAAISAAIAKAQNEVENASKNANNPHFKSKYADLAELLNTVRPVFSSHGLAVLQMPSFDGGVASVETMISHLSGEWISSVCSAPVTKQDAQGVGSAITYLRRYSLAAMCGISQEDDDANSAVGHAKKPVKEDSMPIVDDAEYTALVALLQPSITSIKFALSNGDYSTAKESWGELTEDQKMKLWKAPSKGGCFTTEERTKMKSSEFAQA